MSTPSFIRVPTDSTGKRVDTCQLDVSGQTVERQRVQLAGDASNAVAGITLSGGVPISAALSAPIYETIIASSVSAGGGTDINSTQIPSGMTGKLIQLLVSGSTAFRADLKTVSNAVESSNVITVVSNGIWDFKPVSKTLITVAYDISVGFDGFRVTVTNLDTAEPANFYVTFFYDVE